AVAARWQGRCDACGEWNTLAEEMAEPAGIGGPAKALRKGRAVPLESLGAPSEATPRIATGIAELDRVTGGGIVTGSALLIGGDPGIGKSTLLLQAAAALALGGRKVVYVSGEEAVDQVRMRAERLRLSHAPVALIAETNVADILATIAADGVPKIGRAHV